MADNNIDAFEFFTGKSTESINVRFWFEMFYEEKEYAAVVLPKCAESPHFLALA